MIYWNIWNIWIKHIIGAHCYLSYHVCLRCLHLRVKGFLNLWGNQRKWLSPEAFQYTVGKYNLEKENKTCRISIWLLLLYWQSYFRDLRNILLQAPVWADHQGQWSLILVPKPMLRSGSYDRLGRGKGQGCCVLYGHFRFDKELWCQLYCHQKRRGRGLWRQPEVALSNLLKKRYNWFVPSWFSSTIWPNSLQARMFLITFHISFTVICKSLIPIPSLKVFLFSFLEYFYFQPDCTNLEPRGPQFILLRVDNMSFNSLFDINKLFSWEL